MRRLLLAATALIACGQSTFCSDPRAAGRALAIRNVTVIDGTGAPPIRRATLLIDAGLVRWLGPQADAPPGARTLDAAGRVAIPGLIDLHQHAVGLTAPPGRWLARGVTSVRDPGANLEQARALRAKIDAGLTPGPRMFLGLLVDLGPGQTPESVRQAVAHEGERGIDLVKLYLRTPAGHGRAAIDAAHARGLPVTWHLGLVTLSEALALGVDGVEHLYVFRELMPDPTGDPPATTAAAFQQIYARWARHLDPHSAGARRLFRQMAERGIVWTPTLALAERIARGEAEHSQGWGPREVAVAQKGFDAACRMVGEAHRLGVAIGAGTDLEDPDALHRELALLVTCGLSPAASLQAATRTAGRALWRERELGTLEPGRRADLVLLDADPTRDIRHTTRIWRVVKDGEVYDRHALDGRGVR